MEQTRLEWDSSDTWREKKYFTLSESYLNTPFKYPMSSMQIYYDLKNVKI